MQSVKNIFGKTFAVPLDFDFFKHPVYPYRLNAIQDVEQNLPLPYQF